MKSTSKKRTPTIVNLTVKRPYLTEREIGRLMDCARQYGRYGHRDATMILVAYRHGLQAAEVCDPCATSPPGGVSAASTPCSGACAASSISPGCAPQEGRDRPALALLTFTPAPYVHC